MGITKREAVLTGAMRDNEELHMYGRVLTSEQIDCNKKHPTRWEGTVLVFVQLDEFLSEGHD